MDSSTPFYKQLTTSIFTIFGFSLFTLILALMLLQFRDQQVNSLLENQIPNIENSFEQQSKYIEINELLNTIIHDEDSKNLLENHQLYLKYLGELKRLSGKQARFFEQIILAENAEQENIKRLTNNHQRNILLQQNSVLQLQLVMDELNSELIDKEAKQAKLFQQITQDKVADKVTTSRAKAHAILTQEVNILRQTALAVKNVEVLFGRINLQYSLGEFNYFSGELLQSITLWKPQLEEIEEPSELTTPLLKLLFKLDKVLFVEQNAIAKWRGHLRLSQEYFQRLDSQQLQLQEQRNQLKLPISTVQAIPHFINELLNDKVMISLPQLYIIILSLFALLMIILWVLLSKLVSRIKAQSLANVRVVENVLSGDNVAENDFSSAEEKQLATLVSNVVQPAHSETDYQLLENSLEKIQKNIFDHAQLAFYELSENSAQQRLQSQSNELAKQLLFRDKELSNDNVSRKVRDNQWQDAFHFSALKTIVNTAKKAKREKIAAQCEVLNRFNIKITLTIFLQDDFWQGSVCVNQKQIELVDQIQTLEQQLTSQNNKYQQSLVKNADKLNSMLIRTMLQSQSVSIGSGVTSLQVYRQLTRILDWCRQLQIKTELRRDESIKIFTNVDTRNELLAISQNVMFEANQQRNSVQLALDNHLLANAKINVSLFHRTLVGLARLCLLEQFNSTLIINADIVDKNSGQQIIRFTFNMLLNKPKVELPDLIAAFINYDGQENAVQNVQYLHTLMAATYCKNILANLTKQGFKLSVDMPMAYTENTSITEKIIQEIDLKEANFIFFGENSSLKTSLEKNVKAANGKIECIEKVEHLIKQLSVKHLTQHQVSAVIVSAQRFKNERQQMNQHLSRLPKLVSPKLVILQSSFTHALHSEGFFENTDSPCESSSLINYLANFIKSERLDNLLIPAEVFNQYRFASTQVEVLLAVQSPEKYQHLSRLLYWLGMQVHVVCQAESMQKLWQTGRYLVLLTEFKSSPFIEMNVGKNVSRGVFSLANTSLKKPTEKELFHTQSWQLGQVINSLDIQHLVKLFSPWLKEKQLALSTVKKEKISQRSSVTSERTNNGISGHSIKKAVQKDNKPSIGSLLAVENVEIHQAFDLNLYALNQGSPELAVFMLDGYVAEINNAINALPATIKEKAFDGALAHTAEIDKLTTILAAQELNETAQALTAALNKKALPEVNAKLKLLTQQYQTLTEFVETI